MTGAPLTGGEGIPPMSAATYEYWDEKRGPGPRVMAADTLEGDDVRNDADEKLGELSHIMIDVPTGRVVYRVLSVGGFLASATSLSRFHGKHYDWTPPSIASV